MISAKKLFLALIFITAVAAGIGWYAFKNNRLPLYNSSSDISIQSSTQLTTQLKEKTGGKIYLSLFPDNGASPLGIYTYDVRSGALSRIVGDPSAMTPDYSIAISPSLSDDGTLMTFAMRKKSEPAFQIFTANADGSDVRRVTESPEQWKREPVLSPSKELIAYIAQNNPDDTSTTTAELPESWGVYLTDLSGGAKKVTDGINPLFSPDGKKLLVLKNDGLHLFNISDPKKPVVIGLVVKTVGGRASQSMKISLSPDRKHLAWSSPGKNNVVLSAIPSWDTFSLSPFKTLPIKAYWSAFSPDGSRLAVQEIRYPSAKGNEFVVLSVYDLSTFASVDLVKLNKYTNEFMWLGGWSK